MIAFSNTVSGVVYGGNDGGVVSSTNHGLDWTNLNQNLPGALMYSVALSADGSMMAGTQDNGAVFSSAGAHWDMLSGGDSSHDLIDPSDSTMGILRHIRSEFVYEGQHADPRIDETSLQLNWREILTALSFHHSA